MGNLKIVYQTDTTAQTIPDILQQHVLVEFKFVGLNIFNSEEKDWVWQKA